MVSRRRTAPWHMPVLLLGLGLTIYFAVHASTGRFGYEARDRLQNAQAVLAFEIKGLEAQRDRLHHTVGLLRTDPPDADSVTSAARETLGFVHRDDQVKIVPLAE